MKRGPGTQKGDENTTKRPKHTNKLQKNNKTQGNSADNTNDKTNTNDNAEKDNNPNETKVRFTRSDKELERKLTSSLFSELNEVQINIPLTTAPKSNTTKDWAANDDNSDENADVAEAEPAWVDEDDNVLVHAKKKLTKNATDTPISGLAYQEKLRHRHKSLSKQSADWANLSKGSRDGDSDDDDTAFLHKTLELTAPGTRLIESSIQVTASGIVEKHQSGVRGVAFHPTQPLAMSVDGNTLKVYQLGQKMTVAHSVRMLDMDITDACFSADGSQIFLCGNQPSLYVFEVATGKLEFIQRIPGRKEKTYTRVYASPKGNHCVLLGAAGAIVVISTTTKQFLTELKGPSNSVYTVAYSSDGRLFASYAGGAVIVWDVDTRTPVHSFTHPSLQFATEMDISPDDQYLAFGTNTGVVDIFLLKDLVAGGPERPTAHASLSNLVTSINTLKFNHDTQILVIGSDVKTNALRLAHVPSFNVFPNWPKQDYFSLVKDASFSSASGFLVIAENTGKVGLYRLPHYPTA